MLAVLQAFGMGDENMSIHRGAGLLQYMVLPCMKPYEGRSKLLIILRIQLKKGRHQF